VSDDFETTFVVEAAPAEVWQALTERTLPAAEGDSPDQLHYVLPGFPSMTPLPVVGASCTPLEVEPERLLRVRKDHHPCQGTEIAVRLEHAESGTRVTVVQSGFGAFLDIVGKDVVFGHGAQIVADLHLYLLHRVAVPGQRWGASLGAKTAQRHFGLVVEGVAPNGFADRAGMKAGDVLVSLRGHRVYRTEPLWTILALTDVGDEAEVSWIRDHELMSARAAF